MPPRIIISTVLLVATAIAAPARAERIKDIVDIKGIRGNPLQGIGLVVGLMGTGDDSPVTQRLAANIVRRFKLSVALDDMSSKNMAVVMVTAKLGPFSRRDTKIDVTVSAMGNATSLQEGTLLMTPLMGADRQVYAVAAGALSVGGYSAAGEQASVSKNHATVARIPQGATVEVEELATFIEEGEIALLLKNPDFSTAERIAQAVNAAFEKSSFAADAGTVRVQVPKNLTRAKVSEFISRIWALQVKVDSPAVVVINRRTGTIIVGENVGISTVAISHGNLFIITTEKEFVSQPLPFSGSGTTEKVKRTEMKVIEEKKGKKAMHVVPRQVSVAELARALNAMGLTPRDLMSVFEALKEAGALQAELRIM